MSRRGIDLANVGATAVALVLVLVGLCIWWPLGVGFFIGLLYWLLWKVGIVNFKWW